ncbi:MAG TPA: hypothetical protein VEW28_08255 [Candidatus Kapabacteria bacterium]|nr:hypothetical protein [Candidatus Kapabacteria bacterium]
MTRSLGGDAVVLDDHNNHFFTLLPPSGLNGNYFFILPSPPSVPGLAPAFVGKGNAAGQAAVWDGSEWVWSNSVSMNWMNSPSSFPFALTFNTSAGPNSNSVLDLGDAGHHFRTIYVDNIVGALAGFTISLSGDVTGSQNATSVVALRGNAISSTVPTSGQALVYNGSQWAPSNVVSSISSGTGIQVSGSTVNPTIAVSTIPLANGGTGATTQATAVNNLLPTQSGNGGRVLQTDGTNVSWQSAGGNGTVTSVDVSGGTTGLTTSGGPITGTGTITLNGTLAITNGGTGATTQASAINNLLPSQTGNSNKVLQSDGTNVSWQSAGGSGTVSSINVSGGTTGLTTSGGPITGSGIITLGGTLAITNGGTGATTQASAINNLLPAQSTNANKVLQTDGTNVSWQSVGGSTGTVTSVNVSGGTTGLTTSGGPVTNSGSITLGGTLALANGGTGATTQAAAINNLLPTQSSNANKVLQTDGTNVSWQTVSGGSGGWGLSGNSISSGNFLGTINSQDLVIETSSSERLRILSNGNVGIGAPSPGQLLEVRNGNVLISRSGATAGQLQLQGSGTGISSFNAGAQGSANISYVLPIAQGAAGSTLSNDGSGNLSWSNIGQVKFARIIANHDVTSAVLVNDANLSLAVDSNKTYTFRMFLSVSDPGSTGDGYKFAITVPAGSTLKYGYNDATTSAGGGTTIINASGTTTRTLTLNNATEVFISVEGIVVVGNTPGTLQFQEERVGGAAADVIRFNANSYFEMTRVQ